ncbi:hypothetical protein EJ07DRAFT_141478, partial [Lizonia empirigonia]
IDQINEAIAAIESREPGDDLVYQEYADWFGVDRCTLARRHQGRQGPCGARPVPRAPNWSVCSKPNSGFWSTERSVLLTPRFDRLRRIYFGALETKPQK